MLTAVKQELLQYIIIGRDHEGPKGLEKRLAVREAHLARNKQAKKEGTSVLGGAILDADGKMVGSCIITGLFDRCERQLKRLKILSEFDLTSIIY